VTSSAPKVPSTDAQTRAIRLAKLTALAVSARSSTSHLTEAERCAHLAAKRSIVEAREAAERMVVTDPQG